ncbi:MAG: SCO family protein, partial [Thiobacillus sp.]|nr:SCO family protein [Thiobacillus sp.]
MAHSLTLKVSCFLIMAGSIATASVMAADALMPAMAMEHHHDHAAAMDHSQHAAMMDHSQHAAMMAKPSPFQISQHQYTLPELTLRDQAGRAVPMSELQGTSGPLAVNFIFTTCTTICPVMTATFSQMIRELGPDAGRIDLVSITIDPEHDTPTILAKYAERFEAPPNWRFLTGSPGDVERVLRAFDAWSGSITSHRPITLVRRQDDANWVRLEGLGSAS